MIFVSERYRNIYCYFISDLINFSKGQHVLIGNRLRNRCIYFKLLSFVIFKCDKSHSITKCISVGVVRGGGGDVCVCRSSFVRFTAEKNAIPDSRAIK